MVNVTFCALRTREMSASSIEVSTCMSLRLAAITNSSGACRLAATVWPTSTLRLMTMPFTGERICVRSRSMRACANCASRCLTTASAFCAWARDTATCASVAFMLSARLRARAAALSSSAGEMKFLATSSCLRSRSRWASCTSTRALPTWAWACNTLACAVSTEARAASRSAVDWRSRYSNVSGSSRAINWPCLTSLLKSTNSSLIWPDTCELTCTWVTGVTVPDAETAAAMLPRSILALR